MVKLLLGGGAELDKDDWDCETALSRAAASGQDEIVKLLLDYV